MEETVEPRPLRIGWSVPGTFSRLGPHMGMILAMVRYFPEFLPSLVGATSTGAIIMSCCISFQKEVLQRVKKIIIDLKREQIYVLSRGLIKTGLHILAAGGTLMITATSVGSLGWQWAPLLFPLAAASGFARFRQSRALFITTCCILVGTVAGIAWKTQNWPSAVVFCIGLYFVDWLVRRAVHIFFHETESPLDNTPLRNLLLSQEVPQMAFRAKCELKIIATDVSEPGPLIFSNHDPRLCDPENQEHCERFVDGGPVGSSALPGRFPLRIVDGKTPRDGEVWTDFLWKLFVGQVDVVFRFDYWPPLLPRQAPKHWLSDLFCCFDVMRDKNTRDKMEKYNLEREIAEYKRRAGELEPQTPMPRIVNIRASAELLRQIPDLAIYDFKPGQLYKNVVLGYRIIQENLPLIRQELGLPEQTDDAQELERHIAEDVG